MSLLQHPLPANTETKVWINPGTQCDVKVISSTYNSTDTQYHYNLEAQFADDSSNVATVQINDVLQAFVIQPEVREDE